MALGAAARVVLRKAIGVAVGAPAVGHRLAAERLAEAVAGSIVVALEQRGLGGIGRVRARQRVPRSTEVVVHEGHARRHHVRRDVHVGDAEARGRAALERDGTQARSRGLGRVRDDEATLLAIRAVKEERRAHLGQEAPHEVEIALSVLRAEGELRVALRELEDRLDAVLAEDLLHDLRHGQVLEEAMAAPVGQEPEVRHDAERVGREPSGLDRGLGDVGAHAGPRARAELAAQVERRGLADELLDVDGVVARAGPRLDVKRGGHRLDDMKGPDVQIVARVDGELDATHGVSSPFSCGSATEGELMELVHEGRRVFEIGAPLVRLVQRLRQRARRLAGVHLEVQHAKAGGGLLPDVRDHVPHLDDVTCLEVDERERGDLAVAHDPDARVVHLEGVRAEVEEVGPWSTTPSAMARMGAL